MVTVSLLPLMVIVTGTALPDPIPPGMVTFI